MVPRIIRIPCDECLTISICRHKGFDQLLNDCSLVRHYMKINMSTSVIDQRIRINNVQVVLKSTGWEFKGTYIHDNTM